MRLTARFVGAAVVVVGRAAEVGNPAAFAVAARFVPLELAHAAGPSTAARLTATRTRRRQTGISAHRNRGWFGALGGAEGVGQSD